MAGARSENPRDGGLARLEAADGRIVALGPPDGLPLNSAPSAFVEDRDGNIWIGLYHGGLVKFREGRFRTYNWESGIPQAS